MKTYYVIVKFSTETPISEEEAEQFTRRAIETLGPGFDIQLFQMGELEENVKAAAGYN